MITLQEMAGLSVSAQISNDFIAGNGMTFSGSAKKTSATQNLISYSLVQKTAFFLLHLNKLKLS